MRGIDVVIGGAPIVLVPVRYASGDLALLAVSDDGGAYDAVSVDLTAEGVHAGPNSIFVYPETAEILVDVPGSFDDDAMTNGVVTVERFTFDDDVEAIADGNEEDLESMMGPIADDDEDYPLTGDIDEDDEGGSV